MFNRRRALFQTSEFLKLNPSKECVFICTGHGKFIARKDLVNCQLILVRFQSIERTFCIMSLDKISCGKLLIRKLISFHFFDAESQICFQSPYLPESSGKYFFPIITTCLKITIHFQLLARPRLHQPCQTFHPSMNKNCRLPPIIGTRFLFLEKVVSVQSTRGRRITFKLPLNGWRM